MRFYKNSKSADVKRRLFLFVISALIVLDANAQTEFTTCLYDSVRQRPIPIAVYRPARMNARTGVIIFNHGYGANDGGSYKSYSCLTGPLAKKGYCIISIQHELANDSLLAMEGEFMKTRMPDWERGVENILFVLCEFRKLQPGLGWNNLTIIGHSNGGDIAMLFAMKYPGLIKKTISLDHRRMVVPRVEHPQIYTLRGCDYEADPHVIPTEEEQKRYNIRVISLKGIRHGDMDNKGSREQHRTILGYLEQFLKK